MSSSSLSPSSTALIFPPAISPIPSFLRKLGYILGIILGSTSVLGAICSRFLLPLLYSSFSARTALTQQSLQAFISINAQLKRLRAGAPGLYKVEEVGTEGKEEVEAGDGDDLEGEEHAQSGDRAQSNEKRSDRGEKHDEASSLLIEDLESSTESIAPPSNPKPTPNAAPSTLFPSLTLPSSPNLSHSLTDLPNLLSSLSTALASTSTTRTSLLSVLNGYVEGLRDEEFTGLGGSRSGGIKFKGNGKGKAGWGSVGLGSLGETLARESSSSSSTYNSHNDPESSLGLSLSSTTPSSAAAADKQEVDYDDIRKEIRALKGLLLSRRNLMPGVGGGGGGGGGKFGGR